MADDMGGLVDDDGLLASRGMLPVFSDTDSRLV